MTALRLRRDLGRPTHPIGRDELPLLGLVAVSVISAAQWDEPGTTLDLVLVVIGGIALVVRPLVAAVPAELMTLAVVAPVACAIGHEGHLELAWFLVVTAILAAAWQLGSTVRSVGIAVTAAGIIWFSSTFHDDSFSPLPWVAASAMTLLLGRTLAHQRTLIAELEDAREALAVRAVAEERQHIARELHDLAGHTLAAVLLNVTGARHLLRRDPDEAERALREAESVGRASMDQIRATVAALRTSERGTDPPLTDALGLAAIVDDYRRAGLAIETSITPDASRIGGPIAIAVDRVGREALANVARHAPTNRVVVTVDVDAIRQQLVLSVGDRGRRPDEHNRAPGFGLIGMNERVRALGGTFAAGPTDDGWTVEASFPFGPNAWSRDVDTVAQSPAVER